MNSTAARMDQVQATASFNTCRLIASHVGGAGINIDPQLSAMSVTSARTSEHKIDMALEMLAVNSMIYALAQEGSITRRLMQMVN